MTSLQVFKRDFRRLLAAAVLSGAAIVAPVTMVSAQEVAPEVLALARQYVDLTDRSAIYEVTLVEMAIQTRNTLLQQSPDLAEPVDAAITRTLETYRGRKGELLDQFARLYALRFTMAELQEIVDFYGSPVGMKLSAANAELNAELTGVLQVFTNNLRSEFFAKVRAEMRAAGVEG